MFAVVSFKESIDSSPKRVIPPQRVFATGKVSNTFTKGVRHSEGYRTYKALAAASNFPFLYHSPQRASHVQEPLATVSLPASSGTLTTNPRCSE
ncbi:uncharacterized protein G2W53_018331 [Senna tora]|uniref:Uncharacterized protein n=1 Tax=Senna tora TaxID=362788 RepID=A0A834WL96_9FABA|nr:uncharacterized protein G2W53_018331 [Senna tora]